MGESPKDVAIRCMIFFNTIWKDYDKHGINNLFILLMEQIFVPLQWSGSIIYQEGYYSILGLSHMRIIHCQELKNSCEAVFFNE